MKSKIAKDFSIFVIVAVLLLVLFPMSCVHAATNTRGGVPGPGNGVPIRQTCQVHQLQFDDFATDIHFKLWQQEDNIDVNGWEVDISDFTNSQSDYGWQPEPAHSQLKNEPRLPPTNNPDSGRHAVDVDASGANIPKCTWVTIRSTFWLTAKNTKHIEVEWTKEGYAPRKAFPEHGWNFEWPMADPDNPGQYVHLFSITNDDEVEWLNVTQLAFNATMDWYDDLTQVYFPALYPNFTIAPGETWFTNVTTSGSLVGGHIYFKFALHGSEVKWLDWVDHPVTAPPVDMVQKFYPDVESAYSALQSGDVDIVDHELTGPLYEDAINDQTIGLGQVVSLDMYQLDLNNNWTIADYPSWRSPMNYSEMRQAIALMTDKDYIVDTICDGFAERIDQPVAASHKGWANTSMWYPNYPWEYGLMAAAATLDSRFSEGSTPNPYYDPGFPGSAIYIRTYPAEHEKAGEDLDPLIVCVRTDDNRMWQAGQLVYGNMRKLGIPVNPIEGPQTALYDRVTGDFNYHLFTGCWSRGRFPPLYDYTLYHSISAYSYGPNYVTGVRPGLPTHPKLDEHLYNACYAVTYAQAVGNIKLALGYMTEICVTIPLFSPAGYYAWTSALKGVVNAEGVGPLNKYTYMNAYKVDGSPIVVGCVGAPQGMNVFYDVNENLRKMNIYNEIETPPYNLGVDQPGFITDWVDGTYVDLDDLGTKSLTAYWYRTDGGDALPYCGDLVESIDARNIYAGIWYSYHTYQFWLACINDVKTLRLIDGNRGLEVYWDTQSYWHLYQLETPALSFNLLKKAPISGHTVGSYVATVYPDGVWVDLPDPVWWVEGAELHATGTSLIQGVDYEIYSREGYVQAADVRILNPALIGQTIDIDYWWVDDAAGHAPGNLPWGDPTSDGNPDPPTAAGYSFEGAGIYYATEYVPGVGGYLSLQKNPNYWMETPPLGEIDFARKTSGCMKIDIFDIVIAAMAYRSQGELVPDTNWFPGADLAPTGCKVDIFDIVTIAGKYGEEWDYPPP